MCREKKIVRHNNVAKQQYMFNYLFKKIQKQPQEGQKQSPEEICKKMLLKISQASQENTCVGDFLK